MYEVQKSEFLTSFPRYYNAGSPGFQPHLGQEIRLAQCYGQCIRQNGLNQTPMDNLLIRRFLQELLAEKKKKELLADKSSCISVKIMGELNIHEEAPIDSDK